MAPLPPPWLRHCFAETGCLITKTAVGLEGFCEGKGKARKATEIVHISRNNDNNSFHKLMAAISKQNGLVLCEKIASPSRRRVYRPTSRSLRRNHQDNTIP